MLLPQRLALYIALLLLGTVAILRLPPLLQVCGGLAAFVGAAGLLVEGWRHLQREQQRQRNERDAARRAEQKAARRARQQDEREQRHTERQTQRKAETLRREADAHRHAQKRQQQEAAAQRRIHFASRVEQEAQRLQFLPPEEWAAEACRILAGANSTIQAGTEAGEFLCRLADGSFQAVFVLLEPRESSANDVNALEAFRRETSAERAALVSRTGFAPEAIRAASAFPLTLLDPLVLARMQAVGSRE